MRRAIGLLLSATLVSCQSAPRDGGAPETGVGTTTYTRGAPSSRTDTVRASGEAPMGTVSLTVDRASYAPGARVAMRVSNGTRDTLGYNQCSSRAVERQLGSSWVTHAEPGRMCTMELRLLSPKEAQTAITDLPIDAAAGTYRLVLTLSRQSPANPGAVRAVSPVFTVD